MVGRADEGIIITTGTFTHEAMKEAVRDDVPPLELVDGFKLVKMLEQLEIGLIQKRHIKWIWLSLKNIRADLISNNDSGNRRNTNDKSGSDVTMRSALLKAGYSPAALALRPVSQFLDS
jgi:hypothetical protein